VPAAQDGDRIHSSSAFASSPSLARQGLLAMVDVIVGGEDVEREKPDPAGLSAAVERLDVAPTALLYVGDSPTDAESARRAGSASPPC